jgi:hypothetical protein
MNESKEQLETLLSDYVDGNLAGEHLATVESYLEKNPGVRDAVNRLMIDSEALRSLPRVNAPFDFSEDVRGQIERDILLDSGAMAFPTRRRVSSLFATVAAMLMLFVGLGGAAYWMLSNRPAPFMDLAINHAPLTTGETAATDKKEHYETVVETAKDSKVSRLGPELRDDRAAFDKPAGGSSHNENEVPPATILGGSEISPPAAAPTLEMKAAPNFGSLARRAAVESSPPIEVAQLVDEAPRYNRRALAIVIDAKDAPAASHAVTRFVSLNAVRMQKLSYDSVRNRAVASEEAADAAVADVGTAQEGQPSQVSGVLTNSGASPITQAIEAQSAFTAALPGVQVVMAIGLTDAQVHELHDSLQTEVGENRSQAYELGDSTFRKIVAQQVSHPHQTGGGKSGVLSESNNGAPATQPAIIANGDRLRIRLMSPDVSKLNIEREVIVDAKGMVEPPQLENVRAAGMTLQALRQSIVERYITQGHVADPVVDIELLEAAPATQPLGKSNAGEVPEAPNQDGLIADREKVKTGAVDLVDVYIVVRGQEPTTQPTYVVPGGPTTQPQ